MAFRLVKRTQDWIQEHSIGLRLKRLLVTLRPLGKMAFGFMVASLVWWAVGRSDSPNIELSDQFRIAGWFLQVLGLGTVALGLKKTRAIFGVPTIREQVIRQLRNLFRRQEVVKGSMDAQLAPIEVKAYGAVASDSDASVEERLEALEEKYEQLNQQLIDARKELKLEARRLDRNVEQEQRERSEADGQIREQLEAFSVGGLHLESMGLVWLFVGITCATLPDELASLVVLL